MTLQEQLKKDLVSAMKEKDDAKKSTIRIIMGEFGRSGKKELSDDDVIKVLKKLIKSERETLGIKGDATDSQYIKIIENYLPKTPSKEEIKAWVIDNIDFSQFKNKMQAMKPIMKHFGASADGNTVKTILQDI
jgi:hypothetical protein